MVGIVSCDTGGSHEPTRVRIRADDEGLQRSIIDRLESDPAFSMARGKRKTMIVVKVDEGYVTLSGFVRSSAEKRRADILARALGALGVDNRLQLDGEVEGR